MTDATPPPDAAPVAAPPPPRRKDHVMGIHVGDFLGVAGCAWALIGSVQPYYTVTAVGTGTTAELDAWHGLLSGLGVVLAVAGSVVLAVSLTGVGRGVPLRSVAVVLYLVAATATLASYFVTPSGLCDDLVWLEDGCAGAVVDRGVGFWRTFLGTGGVAFVVTYWAILRRPGRAAG